MSHLNTFLLKRTVLGLIVIIPYSVTKLERCLRMIQFKINSVNETIDIANVTANDNDFALVKLKQRVNAITIAPVMMDQGTVSPNYPSGEF